MLYQSRVVPLADVQQRVHAPVVLEAMMPAEKLLCITDRHPGTTIHLDPAIA